MSQLPSKILPISDNLRAAIWQSDDNTRAAIIYFQARELEEIVSFQIETSAPIVSQMWRMPQLQGGHWLNTAELSDTYRYSIFIDRGFLDIPFIVGLELDVIDSPVDHILKASIWDRADASPQIVYIEFPEAEQDAAANP